MHISRHLVTLGTASFLVGTTCLYCFPKIIELIILNF
jgi:hypothetical protein